MDKRAVFSNIGLPLLLIAPQFLIVAVLFYWPAGQAIWQSFLMEDAFGTTREFVGLANYREIFARPDYFHAFGVTLVFSSAVAFLALTLALFLAVQADKAIKGARFYSTLLIWPYAVAPAIAGLLMFFLFSPTLGLVAGWMRAIGIVWNPLLSGRDALILVIIAATWKQISYNFLFFLAGLQSIPKSLIEAATIDGAKPTRRFWTIILPLLSPTAFFLLVMNVVYVFFDTFGIIDAITGGGPAGATTTLVYKVFHDGKGGSDLGGSAAQSVILMILVIALTAVQFRYVERKVTY